MLDNCFLYTVFESRPKIKHTHTHIMIGMHSIAYLHLMFANLSVLIHVKFCRWFILHSIYTVCITQSHKFMCRILNFLGNTYSIQSTVVNYLMQAIKYLCTCPLHRVLWIYYKRCQIWWPDQITLCYDVCNNEHYLSHFEHLTHTR